MLRRSRISVEPLRKSAELRRSDLVSAFGHQGIGIFSAGSEPTGLGHDMSLLRSCRRFRIDIYKDFAPTSEHDPGKIQMRDTHAKVEALQTGARTMRLQPEFWKVRRIRRTREQKCWRNASRSEFRAFKYLRHRLGRRGTKEVENLSVWR
jgi:hypothetical protein